MATIDPRLWAIIQRYAPRYGLDPRAVAAVAMNESSGRFGAVGDNGTSFGPWQLHVGGALPRGRGAAWANSLPGVLYAFRQMSSSGARGLRGQAAVSSIARNFERPANPSAEIATAMSYYRSPGFARGTAAAGAGGVGATGDGGAPRNGGGGNPAAVLALLGQQAPLQVSPSLRQTPTVADTLQSLYAPLQQQQTLQPNPFPQASTPGPTDLAAQLDSIHQHLLKL